MTDGALPECGNAATATAMARMARAVPDWIPRRNPRREAGATLDRTRGSRGTMAAGVASASAAGRCSGSGGSKVATDSDGRQGTDTEASAWPLPFRLVRRFVVASTVAFVIFAAIVYVLQRNEEEFFRATQGQQASFVARLQGEHEQRQRETSLAALMSVHEAGHVNLANLFANVLWDRHLAAFVARAGTIAVDSCRAEAPTTASASSAACFADAGRRIRALPGFDEIDGQIRATMASTTVYKVKLYDLRGVTVYSSEPEQVGEDRSGNAGWLSARHGIAASELTHRDRLSAFEGVVENRDVIQTYVPLHRPGSSTVVAVFEIYSDATPFVDALGDAGARLARTAEGNLAAFQRMAGQSYNEVRASSRSFLAIVYGMLLLLYVALLAIVRDGQRVIDRQAKAQGEAMRREEARHRDKMAALATMANNVSHQIGNPLAIITGIAEDLARHLRTADPAAAEQASRVIDETTRIAGMTREIADLAASGSDAWEWVDLNAKVSAACRFLSFDHRLAGSPIDFRPGSGLPACAAIPGALTEVLMDLLQICGERQARDGEPAPIVVETFTRDGDPIVRVGSHAFASAGTGSGGTARTFDAMRRRCASFRARLDAAEGAVEVVLVSAMPAEGEATGAASSGDTSRAGGGD